MNTDKRRCSSNLLPRSHRCLSAFICGQLFFAGVFACAADVRLGIIGTDTSHATEFTRIYNDAAAPDHAAGARVVAAYKGGSPDVKDSRERVDKFAEELRTKWGVRFVEHIADLCPLVDGILLESVDGRTHLAQARAAFTCGKPVFIDKPLASTLEDARAIARLAVDAHVAWFSSSSVRFSDVARLASAKLNGATVWGPGPLEEHHALDLSWYAIHPIELLYTLMGTGCEQVTRVYTPDTDVVVGRWKGGRIGTVRALRPYGKFGAVAFYNDESVRTMGDVKSEYTPLLEKIVTFMETGTPPVSNSATLELFAFLDAAQRSRESGGKPVSLR